jgi:hypothetical protein
MNDLQFAGRYECLPIRCSGRLISLQNEQDHDGLRVRRLLYFVGRGSSFLRRSDPYLSNYITPQHIRPSSSNLTPFSAVTFCPEYGVPHVTSNKAQH